MSAGREAFLLIALSAALYLTGAGSIPFYTRGEPREGLVVQEMLRTGAWLVPMRPDGEPARKPPLYYWSAAVTLHALPEQPELALRLPSALLATAAVLATWATARAAYGAAAGLPAALVLATAFEWTRAATSARVDMALASALTIVLASWTFTLARGSRWAVGAAAVGALLGTLAKGPVALVLPGLAAATLTLTDRGAGRRLRPLAVLGLAAGLAALWYWAAFRREGGALLDVVARENWLRFLEPESAETGHAHGPGYLVPLGLVGLLPWTPILPLLFLPLRERPRPAVAKLAAAWCATTVVFFTLAAAKRSVYLLPIYPAVALLIGAGVAAPPENQRITRATRLTARLYAPAALVLALGAAALALGFDPAPRLGRWLAPPDAAGAASLVAAARGAALPLVLLALATAAVALALARAAREAEWHRLVLGVAALMVAWTVSFDALLHPAIAQDRSLKTFGARVAHLVPADATLYALFPPDPGLRFYAPRPLHPWPAGGASADAWLLLWEDEWRRLRDGAGRPLPVLAVSEARQALRGHLALVVAPHGPLVPARDAPGTRSPAGLRRGS